MYDTTITPFDVLDLEIISSMPNLTVLDISNNKLITSTGINSLVNMNQLEYLDIRFIDNLDILPIARHCCNLETLKITSDLEESVLNVMSSNLSKLKYFSLQGSTNDTALQYLSMMNIERLELHTAFDLTEKGILELVQCSSLRELSMKGIFIENEILFLACSQLKQISALNIGSILGKETRGIEKLNELEHLEYLDLSSCFFSESFLEKIKNLKLKELVLDGSVSITQLKNLKHFPFLHTLHTTCDEETKQWLQKNFPFIDIIKPKMQYY